MLSLPLRVGPLTLTRRISVDPVAETYQGLMHGRGDQPVRVRRLLPAVCRRPGILAQTEARVRDLLGVRHPLLAGVIEWIVDGEERLVVEEWVDGLSFAELIDWSNRQGRPIETSVLLHLVTQACNALEALHARPGRGSGRASVLHLALTPSAMLVDRDGRLCLTGCGLVPTPALLVPEGSLPGGSLEYLSPEQTAPEQALEPASDLFVLGAIIGEMALLAPIFRSESHLRTLRRVRTADASAELVVLAERYPGLDRVVARCLARDPRQRYRRASSLREDLRLLLAPYRFDEVMDDTRLLIEAGLGAVRGSSPLPEPPPQAPPLVLRAPALDPEPEELSPPASNAAVMGAALPLSAMAAVAAASHSPDADSMVNVVQQSPSPPPGDEGKRAREEEPPTEATQPGPRHTPLRSEISSVFLRPPEPLPSRHRKAPLPAPSPAPPPPTPPTSPPPQEEHSNTPWLVGGTVVIAAAGLVLLVGGMLVNREKPAPQLEQMALRPELEPAPAAAPALPPPAPPAPTPASPPAPPAPAPAVVAAPAAPLAEAGGAAAITTGSTPTAPRPERAELGSASGSPGRPSAAPARSPAPSRPAVAPARVAAEVAPTRVATEAAPTRVATEVAPTRVPGAPAPAPLESSPQPIAEPDFSADLNRMASLARDGRLSKVDIATLEALPSQHPDWGRARSMLLLSAQKSGDNKAVGRQLEALMSVPENRYNPLLLVDRARYQVNVGSYAQALDSAQQAEKQWARIPSSQVFAKKAEIYEIQAAAWQGLFYQSQGDLSMLDQALRSWERYKEHVQGRSRPELGRKADAEIARLQQIRARVE